MGFDWGRSIWFLGTMNGGDEVVAAPGGPPQQLEWKFSQVFGERTAGEEVQEGITKILVMMMSMPSRDCVNATLWIRLIFSERFWD